MGHYTINARMGALARLFAGEKQVLEGSMSYLESGRFGPITGVPPGFDKRGGGMEKGGSQWERPAMGGSNVAGRPRVP